MDQPLKLVVALWMLHCVCGTLPLDDAKATVNQLFTYSLDQNDFAGQELTVNEVGKSGLPSWLVFDRHKSRLLGVPGSQDKGTYILSVNNEMFAVTVTEPTKYELAQPVNIDEPTVCKSHDSITVVYVRLNADTDSMMPAEKVRLIEDLTAHLSLKADHISVSKPSDLLDPTHALVSGNGDISSSGDSLSAVSWLVGCGAVKTHHMDILEKLESTAKDGSMGKVLKTGVSGWQVQSNQPKVLPKRRLKRQVLVTATPTPFIEDSTTTTRTTAETTTKTTTTTTPSPTALPSPATTMTKPENLPPVLNEEILVSELSANVGELVRWQLPDGLFTDPEGEQLTYTVESSAGDGQERWTLIYLSNEERRELVGIGNEALESTGETLRLTATDPFDASNTATIQVAYMPSKKSQLTTKYTLSIKEDTVLSQPAGPIYIALTLQEQGSFKSILTEDIDRSIQGTTKLVVGDNMGRKNTCPLRKNRQTLEMLEEMKGQNVPLYGSDSGALHISSIDFVESLPPCDDAKPTVNEYKISAYNPLRVQLGELYKSTVPIDLFMDQEDGDLSKLQMNLFVDGKAGSANWISYDTSSRQLNILRWSPFDYKPQLEFVVEDSADHKTTAEIEIQLEDNAKDSTNLITLNIQTNYQQFASNLDSQVELYKKIDDAFPNSVVSFRGAKSGSVILEFSLRESRSDGSLECDTEALQTYIDVLFNDNRISDSFVDLLSPYQIKEIDFLPMGSCQSAISPKSAKTLEEVVTQPSKQDNTVTIIVIVVLVIVLIVIIVVIIICVRKKQAQKTPGTARQSSSDIEKRVPVVLDEEMRSLSRSDNEPLMTGADENYKPTATPPAYPGEDGYQPDTPPVSEPDDEQRILDRSP